MNNPLVSIIIPTFNRAHLIDETLNSVLAQRYTNWECIVVDDGSMDATDELMASYCLKDSRFKYYHRPSDKIKGASSCRNIGLFKAIGDYVIFLDSDDLLIENCLENRIQRLKKYPNDFFLVFPMFIEDHNKKRMRVKIPEVNDFLTEFLSSKIHWQTMCTLWDIQFLKQINGFNELYPRLNDPEIHIRALLEANGHYKVLYNDEPDSIYRIDVNAKNNIDFSLKYYESLILLIPDISKKLIEKGKTNHISFLRGYLKEYMNNFFKLNTRKNNIKLFKCFYKNSVISFYQFLYLSILYYSFFIFYFYSEKTKRRINNFFDS